MSDDEQPKEFAGFDQKTQKYKGDLREKPETTCDKIRNRLGNNKYANKNSIDAWCNNIYLFVKDHRLQYPEDILKVAYEQDEKYFYLNPYALVSAAQCYDKDKIVDLDKLNELWNKLKNSLLFEGNGDQTATKIGKTDIIRYCYIIHNLFAKKKATENAAKVQSIQPSQFVKSIDDVYTNNIILNTILDGRKLYKNQLFFPIDQYFSKDQLTNKTEQEINEIYKKSDIYVTNEILLQLKDLELKFPENDDSYKDWVFFWNIFYNRWSFFNKKTKESKWRWLDVEIS